MKCSAAVRLRAALLALRTAEDLDAASQSQTFDELFREGFKTSVPCWNANGSDDRYVEFLLGGRCFFSHSESFCRAINTDEQ